MREHLRKQVQEHAGPPNAQSKIRTEQLRGGYIRAMKTTGAKIRKIAISMVTVMARRSVRLTSAETSSSLDEMRSTIEKFVGSGV